MPCRDLALQVVRRDLQWVGERERERGGGKAINATIFVTMFLKVWGTVLMLIEQLIHSSDRNSIPGIPTNPIQQ